MFQRTFLTGFAVTLLVAVACGSEDNKKTVTAPDAGMGGEAGAAEGPDSGGSSAGEPTSPAPEGGQGGEPSLPLPQGGQGGQPGQPELELLFSVRPDTVGLENTAVSAQANPSNVIYTSSTGSQDEVAGDNAVKILGADLGLDEDDAIVSFTVLQAEPQNPMYLFSVTDGAEGAVSSRINRAYWNGESTSGDVYFSDGVESYRHWGEGGDQAGYHGLLATEASLGLTGWTEESEDDLRGLLLHDANKPITELYFTVNPEAAGVAGSGVASVTAAERGCTVFRSALDGTNSVAFDCADLGLIDNDRIDALLIYGAQAPSKAVFSVTVDSQGAEGSAVEDAVLNYDRPGATLFESPGNGSNAVHKGYLELGLGAAYDDELDAIAVIDAPQPSVASANTCTIAPGPFAANGGGLNYLEGTTRVGPNVLVLVGGTETTPRLVAYNASTCQYLQHKDMPAGFDNPHALALVALPGWSAAAPLDNVEYLRATSAPPELHQYNAAGAPIRTVTLENFDYYSAIAAVLHEPVSDRLYLVADGYDSGYRLHLGVVPRPSAGTTTLAQVEVALSTPCNFDPRITGTDALGNLYVAQEQFNSATARYRVCAFRPDGELLLAPYWWTPEVPIEQTGFIGGGSHFLLSSNLGEGPFVIERGVLQEP